MPDPIKDLEGFPPMDTPHLPAAEVRRRGDRMRRRRQVLGGVGSVVAVAVIATAGTFFLGGNDDEAAPSPVTRPTDSSAALGPVSAVNLLSDEEAVYDDLSDWEVGSTWAGDGQAPADPCQGGTFASLGASSVHQRDWSIEAILHLQHVVSGYPGTTEAATAYDELRQRIEACDVDGVADHATAVEDVVVPGADAAFVSDATWQIPGVEEGGESYARHRTVTAVVLQDDRLSLLTHDMPASDYPWDETESPVRRMLAAVAERLGRTEEQEPGDGPNPAALAGAPASAEVGQGNLADVELDLGLAADPDGELQQGPAADLDGVDRTLVCGTPLIDQAELPTGRLVATASGPEWSEVRQLVGYADAASATAQWQRIFDLVDSCGQESAQHGEAAPFDRVWRIFGSGDPDSVTFSVTPTEGLGGELFQVVKLDATLLVVRQSAEWSTESVGGGVEGLHAVTSALVPEVCAATGGC